MKRRKIIFCCLFFIMILGCGIFVIKNYYFLSDDIDSSFIVSDIIEERFFDDNNAKDEIESLRNSYNNSDIKGIVSIYGEESFNYPIAQSGDNEFYLSHDYYKNYDKYGSIYADYRINLDDSRKILLFGHNSSYIDTPFGSLENYYDKSYYDSHKYIKVMTENGIYKYEIFSVYVETSDFTYMNLNFSSDDEWYQHILKLQSKSIYDIDVTIDKDDSILIMQTCSNNSNYKDFAKKYLLIISKKIV